MTERDAMRETPGSLLKKAREEKKITLKQASEETRITSRHLTALEEDNYSVFPGETYALGFLRSYATYLDLDPEKILQLYRGTLISESEVPLQELTQPTISIGDQIERYARPLFGLALILAFLLGLGIYFSQDPEKTPVMNPADSAGEIDSFLKNSANIPDVETDHVKLRSGFTTAVIQVGKGIDFSIQNAEIYLILRELNYRREAPSTAVFEFYPGKKSVTLKENEGLIIENSVIPKKFRLTLIGATPNNAKIQIDMGEVNPEAGSKTEVQPESEGDNEIRIANPSNFIIRLEAVTTGDNFVEFYVDGKPGKRGQLASGSTIFYEANDSIQMKIGDAGAIDLRINGKQEILGRKGNTACRIYRKVKDPIEQTRFKVEVKDC